MEYCFVLPSGKTLNCVHGGRVSGNGGSGPFAQWRVASYERADGKTIAVLTSLAFPGKALRLSNALEEVRPSVDANGDASQLSSRFFMLKSGSGAVALESAAFPGYFIGVNPMGAVFAANASLREQPGLFTLRASNMSSERCRAMAARFGGSSGGAAAGGTAAKSGGIVGSLLSGIGAALGVGGGSRLPGRGLSGPGGLALPPPDPRSSPHLRCDLTEVQLAGLVHDGYCVFPYAVSRRLVWAALRQINSGLGSGLAGGEHRGGAGARGAGGATVAPELPGETAPQGVDAGLGGAAAAAARLHPRASQLLGRLATRAGAVLSQSPEVLSLLWRSKAWGAVNSIIGHGKCVPPRAAQVALRFPQAPGKEEGEGGEAVDWDARMDSESKTGAGGGLEAGGPSSAGGRTSGTGPRARALQGPDSRWHIDGMDKGKAAPFSLLVGIMLSDADCDDMGNLAVYPGTHIDVAAKIRSDGAGWVAAKAPRPPLSAGPTYVHLKAGDMVVAHPLLPHRVGINFSPFIRYCVYFRVHHTDHLARRTRLPGDLLAVWDGVRELAGGAAGASGGGAGGGGGDSGTGASGKGGGYAT